MPEKEVVVEPDNGNKYIDVNDEPSDDNFVDLGRNSAYALGKKSLHGCLDNGLNCDRIHYCLRRSGRNKDKEVYDSDHAKTVASGSKSGKTEKQGRKRSRETSMSEAEKNVVNDKTASVTKQKQGNKKKQETGENSLSAVLQTRSGPKVLCNAMLQLKPNQKACLEEIGFGGMVEFKVGALKTCKKGWKKGKKDSYFRGPLTVLTTAELLSEREAEELSCGGFGYGELEEDFVEEEEYNKERKGFEKLLTAAEHMFPGNVNLIGFADKYINSLKCTWGGNNSGTNATMPHTQEKEKDVQGEAGCPNMNRVEALNDVGFRAQRNEEVEVGVSDIGVNEQTHGSGKDLMGLTKNSCADVVVEKESLFGFDRQENMCGVLTQKAFESIADEVERSIEKSKIMEIDDRPSFSFGVTQDFDVIPVTNNEKKVLTPMPISAYTPEGKAIVDPDAALSSEESKVTKYLFLTNHDFYTDILFKSKSGQQSDRLQMESVGQDYVETNILDTWAVVRNYMEEYRSNDSPFRLFLQTFVVTRNDDGRFEIVAQHVESVTRATSELNKLKKIDLYGAVTMFDQKKKDKILKKSKLRKGAKIGNSIVAEMLHADFGRYLYGLDHIKSRNIITAELEIGEYDWQTATVRPYAGLILMRIMETYREKGMRNWDLRLDSNRVKLADCVM
ncbi:hypothetical protein Tco_1017090 [Tanacetum coccineum]|uniref:Uncharacterized protein n=1 Tax=Tanacetum coccineum TaxID=301880 RepID=A0ABQ5FRQ1_9ASTR